MAATELGDCGNQFDSAVRIITNLPKNGTFQPSAELKLRFYAYFKQATIGGCKEPKPAFWDVVKRAKWDAWNALGEMPKNEARLKYVDTLRQVIETMSYSDDVQKFLLQLSDAGDDYLEPGTEGTNKAEASTKSVDLNSNSRKISINGGIRPADMLSSEEEVFSDATAYIQAESIRGLAADTKQVLEAERSANDGMPTAVATENCECENISKLNNQAGLVKESPESVENGKHYRKPLFTKCADFKLSPEEKRVLLRWNPKNTISNKKRRKAHGLGDKIGDNTEPSPSNANDLPDGGQSEDRSILEIESHANSSHRSFGLNSSGSESTSHDDSFSSIEWDPRVGAVLMKMHSQLQQINKKMGSIQNTLLFQQQMLNQLLTDMNHRKTGISGSVTVSWSSLALISLWPIAVHLMVQYLYRRLRGRP